MYITTLLYSVQQYTSHAHIIFYTFVLLAKNEVYAYGAERTAATALSLSGTGAWLVLGLLEHTITYKIQSTFLTTLEKHRQNPEKNIQQIVNQVFTINRKI